MHLKARREEAGNRSKAGCEHNAGKKRKHRSSHIGQGGKVKNLAEDRTGIDTLVHDDGRGDHAHTGHSSDREVGTGQENQTRNAERKEHARRRLLQNVQDIVVGKELGVLHNRRHNAQRNEDHHDDNVETVLQEELALVKGVLIVLDALCLRLSEGEAGHAEQIDHVILLGEGLVSSVLDCLQFLLVVDLCIEELILVDVVLVLQLLLQIRPALCAETGKLFLMLLAELCDARLIACLCVLLVSLAVFGDRAQIILLIVLF